MTRYFDTTRRSPLARTLRKFLRPYSPSSMGGPMIPPTLSMIIESGVTDNGERVVPESNDFCFQAHLSIYNFAKPYAHGNRVLDAGCGTGYGSFHLLAEGKAKTVLGIDVSEKAIGYCRSRYVAPNLRFDAIDLQQMNLGGRPKFDLIFTSNVLEHVADVDAFLANATRMLTSDGVFVMAVPCINTPDALEGNLDNPYHINNLTPPAWLTKSRRFFAEVQGYRHWVEPEWVKENLGLRFDDAIRPNNFTFSERTDEAMMAELNTITTILVARGPRANPLPKVSDERGYPADWNVDLGPSRGHAEGNLGPIHCDRPVVQTFVCQDDQLDGLEIVMATYCRVNQCTLVVELRAESADGPILAQSEFPCESIRDNEWLRMEFPAIERTRDRRFALVLRSPDSRLDNAVTAFYTSDAVPGREALTVAHRLWPGNVLRFQTRWSRD